MNSLLFSHFPLKYLEIVTCLDFYLIFAFILTFGQEFNGLFDARKSVLVYTFQRVRLARQTCALKA